MEYSGKTFRKKKIGIYIEEYVLYSGKKLLKICDLCFIFEGRISYCKYHMNFILLVMLSHHHLIMLFIVYINVKIIWYTKNERFKDIFFIDIIV